MQLELPSSKRWVCVNGGHLFKLSVGSTPGFVSMPDRAGPPHPPAGPMPPTGTWTRPGLVKWGVCVCVWGARLMHLNAISPPRPLLLVSRHGLFFGSRSSLRAEPLPLDRVQSGAVQSRLSGDKVSL